MIRRRNGNENQCADVCGDDGKDAHFNTGDVDDRDG